MTATLMHTVAADSSHVLLAIAVFTVVVLVAYQIAVVTSAKRLIERSLRVASYSLAALTVGIIMLRFKVLAS